MGTETAGTGTADLAVASATAAGPSAGAWVVAGWAVVATGEPAGRANNAGEVPGTGANGSREAPSRAARRA